MTRDSVPEILAESSGDHRPAARRKSRQRTRVANGSQLWAGTDGRSLWARRAGELLAATISDLGGPSYISESERALAKRAAVLITELERREAAFARDGAVEDGALAIYQTTVNTLRRTLEALGLQRRAREGSVVPDPLEYARRRVSEAAE